MKKATMEAIVDMIDGKDVDKEMIRTLVACELNKLKKKSRVNANLYAEAHEIVVEVLKDEDEPITITPLWDLFYDKMSHKKSGLLKTLGFTSSKMLHGLNNMWTDIEKVDMGHGKPYGWKLRAA